MMLRSFSLRLCRLCLTLMLLFASTSLSAKDFGVRGVLFPIEEEDLLVHIETKLRSMGDKKIAQHQKKVQDDVVGTIKKPKKSAGITKATQTHTRMFDPTFEVEEDIRDAAGTVIHEKGTKINPLELAPFAETWLLIDAEDEAQRAWARAQKDPNTTIKTILVSGTPGAQEDGSWFYFDQGGEITRKLGILHVPAKVRQQAGTHLIAISEVALED